MAINVKNALELKGGINGLKMILGASLIVLAHQLNAANELLQSYPDSAVLHGAVDYVSQAINILQNGLDALGKVTIGVGFFDKLRKLFSFGTK